MVSQIFAVLGLCAGLWAAGWVSPWLGAAWCDTQPAMAFMILRWVVVATVALAVASLFHWWGEVVRGALKATPAGWLDRIGGFAFGSALGATVVVFALLGILHLPWPRELPAAAARARLAKPMLSDAARVCAFGSRYVPGSRWLERRFSTAARRAGQRAQSS